MVTNQFTCSHHTGQSCSRHRNNKCYAALRCWNQIGRAYAEGLRRNGPYTSNRLLRQVSGGAIAWGPNRCNEPCRRHAFVRDDCILRFLPANPVAAYRLHTAQLISTFGIALSVRISHTTGEQCRRDIEAIRSYRQRQKKGPLRGPYQVEDFAHVRSNVH